MGQVEADLPLMDQFHPQWWLRTFGEDDYQTLSLENVLQIKEPRTAKRTPPSSLIS
jgi:hypothetical protein